MLTFNYGSPDFWDKVVLTKFISECRMVWYLICGTSWSYKSRTEKVTAGRKSAILPNWCCLLFITMLSDYPWMIQKIIFWIRTKKIFLMARVQYFPSVNSKASDSIILFFFSVLRCFCINFYLASNVIV